MVLRYIGVGFDGDGVAHRLPHGGGGYRQLGKFCAGDGFIQVQVSVLVAHHNVQSR